MKAMPSEPSESRTADTASHAPDDEVRADTDSRLPETVDEDRFVDVETEIRDFVRNDISYLRRPAGFAANADTLGDGSVNKVNFLIQRVAGASLAEINGLIEELDQLREYLHAEGQRVQRELTHYAQLSQAAMKSTRMIADNMAKWKNALPPTPQGRTAYDRH